MMTEEVALINSFVVKSKRERLSGLLTNPKRRKQATSALAHFDDFDSRWVMMLPTNQQNPASIERALRSRGAGDTCHAISEAAALDGKRLPLRTALDQVIGYGMGALLSCIPGKLAFYEGEGLSCRYILERSAI
jgi:hypothetical protein